MTAIAHDCCRSLSAKSTAEAFETMLPAIRRVASYRFRHIPRTKREELISDVIAVAFVAFARLVERGKLALAYPTVLALLAVRRVRAGREVGVRQNSQDVLSPLAQLRKLFVAELTTDRHCRGEWEELADDCRATPADIVAARLDFRSWLSQLQEGKRRIALRLACGDTRRDGAHYFRSAKGAFHKFAKS